MSTADDQAWVGIGPTAPRKPIHVWSGLRSHIGRRFAFLTISCSTVLAFLMTLIQLFSDYEVERAAQISALSKVETSILPGLAESLWLLDEALIKSQLSGIAQLEGVVRVEVLGTEDVLQVVNAPDRDSFRIEYPILRTAGGETMRLGTLVLQASHSHIVRQVLNRAVIVLVTNVLKAACMAFVILYFFQRLVGDNITRLAAFADGYDPEASGQRISLRWDGFEFQSLEQSINQWSRSTETYVEQLRHANREQAEFTYAISHDLKSPTNTMAMLIEELDDLVPVGEHIQTILDDMRATNQRMGRLVVDVLDYSRLVEGEMEVARVNLSDVVADIEKDLAAEIAEANASIQYKDLPIIDGHPMHLRILLQNLISNAVKFHSPVRRPVVRIDTKILPDAIRLTVADNGIGIPPNFRKSIFGLFKRLHSRSAYDGTGLGLAICRRVMSNHGGTIEVTSGIDGGTAFELVFPGNLND